MEDCFWQREQHDEGLEARECRAPEELKKVHCSWDMMKWLML